MSTSPKKQNKNSNNNNNTATSTSTTNAPSSTPPRQSQGNPSPPTRSSSSPSKNKSNTRNSMMMANNNNIMNDEEWFKGMTFWVLVLSVALDIGASSSESWKVFHQFFEVFDRNNNKNNNNNEKFDEEYNSNFTQGVHFFALITHILLPVTIYLAARAKYGNNFLAWHPFEGSNSFISAEFFAFVLWVGGLVVRWAQIFVVISSSSSSSSAECDQQQSSGSAAASSTTACGSTINNGIVPSPVYVQETMSYLLQMIMSVSSSFLPKSFAVNLEILADDPNLYPYIAFLVSPRTLSVLRTAFVDGAGRIGHTLGSAIFFYVCLSSFDPDTLDGDENGNSKTSTTSNNIRRKKLSNNNNNNNSVASSSSPKTLPAPYKGTLLSWLSSGRFLSDIRANLSVLWHQGAVRGTIMSACLLMGVIFYFLIAGTFYVSESVDPATNHKYLYFFFWKIPLPVLSKVIMVMHIICAIETHFIFGFTNLSKFQLFKPFVGPRRYIISQMLAWTCFGVSVVLYRALVPSLEIHGTIPRDSWIAANALSLIASVILLVSSCSRLLYWDENPELFRQSVRPSDIARVALLFAAALLVFFSLFFFLSPKMTKVESSEDEVLLIENVMRQLAICAVCISPVAQGIILFCIPVYNSYFGENRNSHLRNLIASSRNNTPKNNSNKSNNNMKTVVSTSSAESTDIDQTHDNDENDDNNNNNFQKTTLGSIITSRKTMWNFIKKCCWLFVAAEIWVSALVALYVLPNNTESSAIVICLCILAQALYYGLLRNTNGTAATIVRQHCEKIQQEKMNSSSSARTLGEENNNDNNNSSSPSSKNNNNNKTKTNNNSSSGAKSKSEKQKINDRYYDGSLLEPSPRARRALSAFLDIDSKITVNGPFLLSFSLFSHSLIFRWILCVISAMHLFFPARLNQLASFSLFSHHQPLTMTNNASNFQMMKTPGSPSATDAPFQQTIINNPSTWSTLGSFGLACAFFCFAVSVPIAHFSIRGLRGLVVNPFTGTPSFAATQVSSWISHIVSFAFLLYLLVNDLLSFTSARQTVSDQDAAYQEDNRIVFGNYSSYYTSSSAERNRYAKRHDLVAGSHLFRIFITVAGNTMLETGAMFLPYVLSFASILTFDTILKKKTDEAKKTNSLIDAASALTVEERKSLEKFSEESSAQQQNGNKNDNSNNNISNLVKMLLAASDRKLMSPQTNSLTLMDDEIRFTNSTGRRPQQQRQHYHRKQLSTSSFASDDDLLIDKQLLQSPDTTSKDPSSSCSLSLSSPQSPYSDGDIEDNFEGILATVHPAVLVLIIFCLSCTAFLLVLIGEKMLQSEVLANAGNVPDAALVFIPALLGLLSCTAGIVIAHAWLGPALFDENSYVLWMPFRGGMWFIVIQISGFTCFTASFVQSVFCFAAVMSRSAAKIGALPSVSSVPVSLIPVAAMSGLAPLLIALSALFFVPSSSSHLGGDDDDEVDADGLSRHRRQLSQTFISGSADPTSSDSSSSSSLTPHPSSSLSIEDNAEGIICLLVLFGGWFVSVFTDQLTPTEWASATAPLIIVSILLSIAAPLGVISLRKSANQWSSNNRNANHQSLLSDDNANDDEDANNLNEEDDEQEDATTNADFDPSSPLGKKGPQTAAVGRNNAIKQSTSSSANLLAPPLIIVESLIVSLLCVLPLVVVYSLYQLASSASTTGFEIWSTLQDSSKWIFGLLMLGILTTLYARGFFGIFMAYSGTYLMFMVPNSPYIVAVLLPLLRPNSISAIWVPIEFCFSVPLPAHWIQPVLFLFDSAFLSMASKRLICLVLCNYYSYSSGNAIKTSSCINNKEVGGCFCSNLKLAKNVEANFLFGSTIPQALEHTILFLICLLYKFSFIGSPAVRGTHRSPLMERLFRGTIIAAMERFFSLRIFAEKSYVLEVNRKISQLESDGKIVYDKKKDLARANVREPKNKKLEDPSPLNEDDRLNFIFGFHPHGILAFTCAWIPLSNVWRSLDLPRRCSRFGASIIFNVPILRDAAMSLGARIVTKESILYTLQESEATVSAMLVPGGQAEMLESKASKTEVYVKNHHKGFLRIALRKNKPAVPVFCFGEHDFMENVQMPKVQRFFLKLIGFGLPVVPMGALGFLPLPKRVPLTLVVGNPVDPADILKRIKESGGKKVINMESREASPITVHKSSSNSNINNSSKKNKKEEKASAAAAAAANSSNPPSPHQHDSSSNLYYGYEEGEIVDMFADEYFAELKRIFYKYRAEAGYPDLELIFTGKNY